jgi:5-formyltetrahydrofolate cyclo-ligase
VAPLAARQRRAGLALTVLPGLAYLLALLIVAVVPGVSLGIYGGMPSVGCRLVAVARTGQRTLRRNLSPTVRSSLSALKQQIRLHVWHELDAQGISTFPRPVRGRIPNVKGAEQAAEQLAATPEWQAARVIKVNPDAPQRPVRFRALREGKTLLMPTPRLRAGFVVIDPSAVAANRWWEASSIKGAFQLGIPISLDHLPALDLLVFGSVAVSPQGDRVGKGEGYAELEFAVLRTLGRVPERVTIATTVHDAQVVDSIPREPFDVALDLICTPTRTIRVRDRGPRPPGVLWGQLPANRRAEMPILQTLYERLDR